MSLGNLFSIADLQYQALVKNAPRGEWSIVILASLSWPWWANDVTLYGADPNAAPVVRGRLEYSPSQAVETKVGNRSLLLLSPARFSGQITATTEHWAPDNETLEYSNSPVSVSISAPTALNFQAGKYQVETTGQDPLVGPLNLNVPVTDNSITVTVNDAADFPGGVIIFLQDPATYDPALALWGLPFRYPVPIPIPHQ